MSNPFEPINARLTNLEALTLEVLQYLRSQSSPIVSKEVEPYGDFKWLTANCPGVPSSTLRIKSASGEIPGVVKFGKRVLYEKAVVLDWLRSQTRRSVDSALIIEQGAEAQFNRQLNKKGGERV